MSSQEMDDSYPSSQEAEVKSDAEMISIGGSLESEMDCSEPLENGKEDGNEDNDDQNNSSHNDSSSDEEPRSQTHSPVQVKVSVEVVSIKARSQEVSSDYGTEEFVVNSETSITLSRENSGGVNRKRRADSLSGESGNKKGR